MRQRTTNMTSQPRAAPRRSVTAVAGKRPPAPERLFDVRFREEDPLDAPPIGLVDAEFQWDDFDLPEEAAEEVGSEERGSGLDRSAGSCHRSARETRPGRLRCDLRSGPARPISTVAARS